MGTIATKRARVKKEKSPEHPSFGEAIASTPATPQRKLDFAAVIPSLSDEEWEERTAVITKPEHEEYTLLAREFVEEIVEAVPQQSLCTALKLQVESDSLSLLGGTATCLSDDSFTTVDGGPTSLPDLLQPEVVYKSRQSLVDTDTDTTTDYESAVETDPLSDNLPDDPSPVTSEKTFPGCLIDSGLGGGDFDRAKESPEPTPEEFESPENLTIVLVSHPEGESAFVESSNEDDLLSRADDNSVSEYNSISEYNSANSFSEPSSVAEKVAKGADHDEVPIPRSQGYNLDFLDDPNFDPFQSRGRRQSQTSPPKKVEDLVVKAEEESVDGKAAEGETEAFAQVTSSKSEAVDEVEVCSEELTVCLDLPEACVESQKAAPETSEEGETELEPKASPEANEENQLQPTFSPKQVEESKLNQEVSPEPTKESEPELELKVSPKPVEEFDVKPEASPNQYKESEQQLKPEAYSKPSEESEQQLKPEAYSKPSEESEQQLKPEAYSKASEESDSQTELKESSRLVEGSKLHTLIPAEESEAHSQPKTTPKALEESNFNPTTSFDLPSTTEAVGIKETESHTTQEVDGPVPATEDEAESAKESDLPTPELFDQELFANDTALIISAFGEEETEEDEETCESEVRKVDESASQQQQPMKPPKMADEEGNQSNNPTNTSSTVDENTNPFQSRNRLARSPSRGAGGRSDNQSPKRRFNESMEKFSTDGDTFQPTSGLPRSPPVRAKERGNVNRVVAEHGQGETGDFVASLNHSEAGPEIAEGLTKEEFRGAEEAFKDPSAFDFLAQKGCPNQLSSLARESLYVRFDPLVGEGISATAALMASMSNASQQAAKGDRLLAVREESVSQPKPNHDTSSCSAKKPITVVDSVPLPRSVDGQPAKTEKCGLQSPDFVTHTLEDPSITQLKKEEHDKLISFSPSPKKAEPRSLELSSSVPSAPKGSGGGSCSEPTSMVAVASAASVAASASATSVASSGGISEVAVKEAMVRQQLYYQEKLLVKDQEMSTLQQERMGLQLKLSQLEKSEKQMSLVVTEYEQTIGSLIEEKERQKGQFEAREAALTRERDQALEDLRNVENAFTNVHRKYERTKATVEAFVKNEGTLKACVTDYRMKLKNQEEKYEKLKAHAEKQLESAQLELEATQRSQEAEIAKLKILLKKSEMKSSSLELSLEQKTKENSELAAICDELINKVGS